MKQLTLFESQLPTCVVCNKPFERTKNHWQTCSRKCHGALNGRYTLTCVVCGDMFRRDYKMKTPLCSKICRQQTRLKCGTCKQTLPHNSNAKQCWACYVQSRKRSNTCQWCGIETSGRRATYCVACRHKPSRLKHHIRQQQRHFKAKCRTRWHKEYRWISEAMQAAKNRQEFRQLCTEEEQWKRTINNRRQAMRYRGKVSCVKTKSKQLTTWGQACTTERTRLISRTQQTAWHRKCTNTASNLRKRASRLRRRKNSKT